jgi:TRAP-type C4-dicarboxylate transport system permease small subunit
VERLSITGSWLRRRAENVLVILLTTMFISFLVQIVSRYVFNFPVGWTYEVSLLAWLWGVLWGAAFVLTEREEIRFDIIYSLVGPLTRRIFAVLSGVALIALYTMSLPAITSYVTFMKVETSPHLHMRFDFLYAIYIAFAVATIIRYLWITLHAVRGTLPGSVEPDPSEHPSVQ